MNEAMLRNLSPEELESHLWITEPYSPTHLAVLSILDASDSELQGSYFSDVVNSVRNINAYKDAMVEEIQSALDRCRQLADNIGSSTSCIQRTLDL